MSDALWLHGLQHARLPYPSPCPGICSNIYPLSWWCHPTISSTVAPFSSCLQSFRAPRSFLVSWLLASCMATHSSTLAWKIPWTEEPGRLQSMGSRRVLHDRATSLSLFTSMHWRRKWQPTPVFLPGESRERGAWWAAVYGVPQSRTWLKRLSSSSSSQSIGASASASGLPVNVSFSIWIPVLFYSFFFWDNCRCTCGCKKWYRQILQTLQPVSPSSRKVYCISAE